MKCDVCKNTVEELFLGKIKGTYIGNGKKKKIVCGNCQKKSTIEELKKTLGY